jgi:quinoprotein glucose dehydrogenase
MVGGAIWRTALIGAGIGAGIVLASASVSSQEARAPKPPVEWPAYGNDAGGSKYSPLDDINRGNVAHLKVAWEWKNDEQPKPEFGARPGVLQATPLMIDNVLYFSTPYNRVVAADAETGRELWAFDPKAYEDGQPFNGQGFVHRGVAAWRDGDKLRIFLNSRYQLICLDAKTGAPVESFGEKGTIDLSQNLAWPINKKHYSNTSPPVVYKDLVIVGAAVGDRLSYRNDPPGDVRAYDARTGKLAWTFHTIPQAGETGNDTWKHDAWKFTGHTNVWAPMSLDAARGLLYMPVSTPSNDYYGGRRLGSNLFAESIVCLDAATGERKWHFQIVHHGLWDYDPASAPVLATLNVDGKSIDAVVQLTKQGFAFAFDRVTGAPVWPIEERPVPQSDVPGEESWPTQPFPTKPEAYTEQGLTLADAFDLTPQLKEAAQAEMRKYRQGGLYTPPSMDGTLTRPGVWGGTNWGGGAFDPATGMLYLKTANGGQITKIQAFDPTTLPAARAGEVDADYLQRGLPAIFSGGLPLMRPPYSHLVAIDMNKGAIAWKVPFGDNVPSIRNHPALKGVTLPRRLGAAGPSGQIVTAGGLVFIGSGDTAFYAFDKATGEEVWHLPLPRVVTGTPMTYRSASGRQFIVVGTTAGADAALVAFALDGGSPASTSGAGK